MSSHPTSPKDINQEMGIATKQSHLSHWPPGPSGCSTNSPTTPNQPRGKSPKADTPFHSHPHPSKKNKFTKSFVLDLPLPATEGEILLLLLDGARTILTPEIGKKLLAYAAASAMVFPRRPNPVALSSPSLSASPNPFRATKQTVAYGLHIITLFRNPFPFFPEAGRKKSPPVRGMPSHSTLPPSWERSERPPPQVRLRNFSGRRDKTQKTKQQRFVATPPGAAHLRRSLK